MTLAGGEGWHSSAARGADVAVWDVRHLARVLGQATTPHVRAERQLWCAKMILRCVETASPQERVELRRVSHLASTLRYLLVQATRTRLGSRLRQLVLLVYFHLLGGEVAFDEILVMDVDTIRVLTAALCDDMYHDLRSITVLVVRRISELPHVSPVLVFEETFFESLQDVLESRQTPPRVKMQLLHVFVNLSRHPKLHFKLARLRRVVFFAFETIFSVMGADVVRRASRKMQRAMGTSLSSCGSGSGATPGHSMEGISAGFLKSIGRAMRHMSVAVSCGMIVANLLSFRENRAFMFFQYPDLVRSLELCVSQHVSIRLREVARRAVSYLKEETILESDPLMHLETIRGGH